MSARSQQPDRRPEEGFNLVPALCECLSPGVLVINRNEQILSCTPEAEIWLALPAGKINGASISLLPEAICQMVREALRGNTFASISDFTITNGITRIQQSVERLDRLATAGTLSAGMAHEVKNALVAVKTFVDLLLEKNKDDELAEIVGREMSRVNSIVSQL